MSKKRISKKNLLLSKADYALELGDFVVLDIETTGFSPAKGGLIIEISALKYNNGKISGIFDRLIYPGGKISSKIRELTGITNEMVADAPLYPSVLRDFIEFIGDHIVIAHNAAFDWNRYLTHYSQNIGHQLENEVICTKQLFKALHPEMEKVGLAEMAETYDVKLHHHRALSDATATAECFIKMKEEIRREIKVREFVPTEKDNSVRNMRVTRATYWQKKVGKVTFRRLYVGLTEDFKEYSSAYLDLNDWEWYAKDVKGTLNWNDIDKQMLQKFNVSDREVLKEKLLKENELVTSSL